MQLITRSDFDGLICAVFLKELGIIDSWRFVHPKDLQDGIIEVTQNDCLANVPFVEGCGLWFDHHASEVERGVLEGTYKGSSKLLPSAAHVVYDYYDGKKTLPQFADMLAAVDKVDSAQLTVDEVLNPKAWVLLGFIMDPRTGLGRFRNFSISNYQLMEKMIGWCHSESLQAILEKPDVKERLDVYFEQDALFREMITSHTTVKDRVILTDLRGVDNIYAGNRFVIYSLYPTQNISVWIVNGKDKKGCSAAVGHSIINRTSKVDVGSLMLKYGGGGHKVVGTCQFNDEQMDEKLEELIAEIVELNR